MGEAYIIEALRTPVGKRNGGLSSVRPDELAGFIMRTLLDRTGIPHEDVEDVILGCVTQIREQGLNIARTALLCAGLPPTVPGTSVNRQCGSGAQSINFAAQAIMSIAPIARNANCAFPSDCRFNVSSPVEANVEPNTRTGI